MVSIVILSYKTKNLLKDCLDSLFNILKGVDYEVIVVDNSSKDGSVEMVKKTFPKVRVLENGSNVGFSKGNNIGAKNAKGDYLLFLNSDTQVLDNGIKEMVGYLDKNEEAGIIGGLLVDNKGKPARSYGKFYNLFNVFLMLLFGERQELGRVSHKNLASVDWVSGGFMMVRASLFNKLDGFDEDFFMYIEDVEFCLRAKKMGFKVYFSPDAKVRHIGQGSSNRAFAIMHIYKGLLHLYKKHRSSAEYGIVKGLLVGKAIIAIIIGIITGDKYLRETYKSALKFSL